MPKCNKQQAAENMTLDTTSSLYGSIDPICLIAFQSALHLVGMSLNYSSYLQKFRQVTGLLGSPSPDHIDSVLHRISVNPQNIFSGQLFILLKLINSLKSLHPSAGKVLSIAMHNLQYSAEVLIVMSLFTIYFYW